VPVLSQESQRLYICVSGIDLTLSTIFLLNIVTVMKVWYFCLSC